jgi:hypothetical protein
MGRYLELARKACGADVQASAQSPSLLSSPDELPGDWRAWFEARAAIREYDGNMPRTQAEAEALKDTPRQMQTETTKNLK